MGSLLKSNLLILIEFLSFVRSTVLVRIIILYLYFIIILQDFEACNGLEEVTELIKDKQVD